MNTATNQTKKILSVSSEINKVSFYLDAVIAFNHIYKNEYDPDKLLIHLSNGSYAYIENDDVGNIIQSLNTQSNDLECNFIVQKISLIGSAFKN